MQRMKELRFVVAIVLDKMTPNAPPRVHRDSVTFFNCACTQNRLFDFPFRVKKENSVISLKIVMVNCLYSRRDER